jgi:hypothetical protein
MPEQDINGGLSADDADAVRELLGLSADRALGDPEFHIYNARRLGLADDVSVEVLNAAFEADGRALAPFFRGEIPESERPD